MAYFKHNEPEETRRNSIIPPEQRYRPDAYEQDYDQEYVGTDGPNRYENSSYDDGYDDGFDDPDAEGYDEDELTEEEKQERKKNRIQLLFGAGNLMGIIAGTVVILLLLAFLFQMINFVRDDIYEFFDTIRRFFM